MRSENRDLNQRAKFRFWRDRRGAMALVFAVLLAPLFGFGALGVDIGLVYALERLAQSAVDNAALSGAMELAAGKGVDGGPATTEIQNLSLYAAKDNLPGNPNVTGNMASNLSVATGCTTPAANVICINNPPLLGPFASQATIPPNSGFSTSISDYVEAILGEQGGNVLANLVGYTTPFLVRTRAVAGLQQFYPCMLALNTSGTDLQNNGNVDLELGPKCAFASNSTTNTNPKQSILFNGGVTMHAAAISTAGGVNITGNSNVVSPRVTAFAPPVADPLAGLIHPYPNPANPAAPSATGTDVPANLYSCQYLYHPLGGAAVARHDGHLGEHRAVALPSRPSQRRH